MTPIDNLGAWSAPAPRVARLLRRVPEAAQGYVAAILFVAGAALVAESLYRLFGLTRLSPVFLGAVLICAVTLGARPAFLAAALAFGIYNFYLVEPRFSLSLDSPEEFLTLGVFLAVALLTGGLAGRVRDEALGSKARARTMGALFEASRGFSSTDQEDMLRELLVQHLAAAAKGEAEVHHGGRSWTAAATPVADAMPWSTRPLSVDGADLGLVRWRSAEPPEGASEEIEGLVRVLVDLGVAALARSRLASDKAKIEAVAETERLRTALLSSVSHDFRTPLTAILTSATSLRTFGEQFDAAEREDLLSTIQEEAERLNGYVVNLLNFTKLECGALTVEPAPVSLPEVLGRLFKRLQPRTGGRIFRLDLDERARHASGDAFLLEQALGNVLENAVRFSPPASTVELRVVPDGEMVAIEVADEGPGVPAEERERIFDKFHRVERAGAPHSTGLGLSIARGMIEAMGGRIEAHGRRDGSQGLRVVTRVPRLAT